MNITFSIEYRTQWGESLSLVLQDKKYPMQWGDNAIWSVTVKDCPAAALKDYTYVVYIQCVNDWRNKRDD